MDCMKTEIVTIKDQPIRNKIVYFKIEKRRFFCKSCKKPFIEPVQGIVKGWKSKIRLRKHIVWCATYFSDLKRMVTNGKT